MLPTAFVFLACYIAGAVWLRSGALAGGAFAVTLYCAALVRSHFLVKQGRPAAATRVTGIWLLVMIAVGAPFLDFLYAALLLIPLAGVALALPYAERPELRRYLIAAFAVDAWVMVVHLWQPLHFEPLPLLLQNAVVTSAVLCSVGLTMRLFWVDAQRLRQSLRKAEEGLRTREEFLSIAGHELNTPLTPLNLRLQSMEKRLNASPASDDTLQALRDVGLMRRQIRRLSDLVRELLDVSRLSAGRLQLDLQVVDVGALVRDVTSRYVDDAAKAGSTLSLQFEGPVTAVVDPSRFEQIIANLLSNALKYGAGKPIHFSARSEGPFAQLVVTDQGIGISPEHQERIFEKFERAVPEQHYGGLGLGLYITRELVEAMGGAIRAKSTPGKGATFIVDLPSKRVRPDA